MKGTERFRVVLFIMPYKVVQTFESVDEILKCDYSNESYWAVLSCGAVNYGVHDKFRESPETFRLYNDLGLWIEC